MDITSRLGIYLNEKAGMPTKINIGDSLDVPNHKIKITNIYVDSFHKNRSETYVTYNWVDKADGKKGTSNMSIEALKNIIGVK